MGHRRVIQSANTPGALRGVLTFLPHPLAVLRPGIEPKLITPVPDYKAKLLAELGVDILLVLPFTAELAATSPRDFIRTLCRSCSVAGISVGTNWHFGKGGTGTPHLLQTIGAEQNFCVCISELLQMENDIVCSSRIRELLAHGDIKTANAILGHPFAICGTVEHGQKLARLLGFPTANISLPRSAALPCPGVYEVSCSHGGKTMRGIANVGLRPTIHEEDKLTRLEAHFIGESCDLYGCTLQVQLLRFIRPEQRFPNIETLKTQIERDIASLTSQ